ncbi:MAG TPA: ATP-binding protein [Polyangiaceae bacterium]
MTIHEVLSTIACLGHLAFAIVAWRHRERSRFAPLLSLLVIDVLGWTFADLARNVSRAREWLIVDHLFSSFTPALALHVVVSFVGRTRALAPVALAAYAVAALTAALSATQLWWKLLLGNGLATLALTSVLLFLHRRRSGDPDERRRTELLLLGMISGTLLGLTDLLSGKFSFYVPELGNVGTLFAVALFAVATLRLQLLGREVTREIVGFAMLLSAVLIGAGLVAVRELDPRTGFWLLFALALLLTLVIALRAIQRAAGVARERQRRFALVGRFSAQLAHDLRNPLGAMKGALQFLAEERRAGRSLDAHARFVDLMLEQVDRVDRVVDKYQRMVKLEPSRARLSLNAVASEIHTLQRLALPECTRFELELGADLPDCDLDRDLVTLALENLVRNAAEALPRGGTITLRTSSRRLGDLVAVSVADDGEGMDARELELATAEFFTTKTQGSGLGLSFVERVARVHGGNLRLASRPGQGTLVELTFPASSRAARAGAADGAS